MKHDYDLAIKYVNSQLGVLRLFDNEFKARDPADIAARNGVYETIHPALKLARDIQKGGKVVVPREPPRAISRRIWIAMIEAINTTTPEKGADNGFSN